MCVMKRLFIFLFSLFAFFTASAQEKEFDRGFIVKVGEQAPDFTLSADDGNVCTLSDLKGKVVMLQFTASWCGICRQEMPHIESDIWQKFKDNPDFVLFGIDREETPEKVKFLKNITNVTYPIAYDTDGSVFKLYACSTAGITRNVLIDRDGKIIMLTRRYKENEFKTLCEKIEKELKK